MKGSGLEEPRSLGMKSHLPEESPEGHWGKQEAVNTLGVEEGHKKRKVTTSSFAYFNI